MESVHIYVTCDAEWALSLVSALVAGLGSQLRPWLSQDDSGWLDEKNKKGTVRGLG